MTVFDYSCSWQGKEHIATHNEQNDGNDDYLLVQIFSQGLSDKSKDIQLSKTDNTQDKPIQMVAVIEDNRSW